MKHLLLTLILYTGAIAQARHQPAGTQASVPPRCSALLKGLSGRLEIIRSGDLIGDEATEYIAVQRMKSPKKTLYVARVIVARIEHGRCSVLLNAGKDGPRNQVGYLGIEYIDDAAAFYGYQFEFGSQPGYECVMFFTFLNPQHEPEGMAITVAWNAKLSRFQEVDPSWEFFNSEVRDPPHRNRKRCHGCDK